MLGSVNHAEAMIRMAIDMHRAMQQINEEFGHGLRLRIGMHSGSVLGGIMGTKKLNFDLWGETVEMVCLPVVNLTKLLQDDRSWACSKEPSSTVLK